MYKDMDLSVLIVEDEPDTLEAIGDMISMTKIEGVVFRHIYSASDGRLGLSLYQQHLPDLVITDLLMPEMDGIAMINQIRLMDSQPQIIVSSAYNQTEYFLASIELGINQFILKPIMRARLVKAIQKSAEIICIQKQNKRYLQEINQLKVELSLAEEREKRRIAIELHDTVGQNLSLLMMKLDSLMKNQPSLQKDLAELAELTQSSIVASRSVTEKLSSPLLYELGLIPALEGFFESIQKHYNIQIGFEKDIRDDKIGNNHKVFIFRTLRELIHNIFKHAQAKNVSVELKENGDSYRIVVRDDGVGFSLSDFPQKNTLGLFSIKEAVESLSGSMEITNNNGTTVVIEFPQKALEFIDED